MTQYIEPTTTSGGIAGMTGYDVQSKVILELILLGFDDLPETVKLRPEGKDDLELRWLDQETAQLRHRYYQVKKATDNNPDATWSLADVCRRLLGDAVKKLQGNEYEQVWVLGDRLANEMQQLLVAGSDAPEHHRSNYLIVLHRLAKAEALVTKNLKALKGSKEPNLKHLLDHWNPTSQGGLIDQDIEQVVEKFISLATGVQPDLIDNYRHSMSTLHTVLPDILARITAMSDYGTEMEIADRVRKLLVDQYKLDPIAVRDVIFRNLHGFINDVSKEPGRTITYEEFEEELVNACPGWVVPTEPRPLDIDYLPRHELVQPIMESILAREIIGPSGSGKSSLASEAYTSLSSKYPDSVVLFVEIRNSTPLRNVLVGIANSLRRRGMRQLIGPALNVRGSDTAIIEQVAIALGAVDREIFLLIDCADSKVSKQFRRDLAVFTRALQGMKFHLLAFSQMSIFRELNQLERTSLGVMQESMPGLHFGQFSSLIKLRHPSLGRPEVCQLFDRLSAGLSTGILPNLAQQIARSKSFDDMIRIAEMPAEERLNAAHRDRFDSIPNTLQKTAYRLMCLSLPISATELIYLFPNDLVKMTLQALVDEGLLPAFTDRVEMHETVRAGFESLIPPAIAKETHIVLADYFSQREMLPAQIHHLEKAGHSKEARKLARERFLTGQDWSDLVEYIKVQKCVSADEVMPLLLNDNGNVHQLYLLGDLLPHVQGADTTSKLMESLLSDQERYSEDSRRTWRLQETLLKCDPSMLTRLATLALNKQEKEKKDYLDWLHMNAWRARIAPDATFVQWFNTLPMEKKKKVVGFLLLKPDLSHLQQALAFMNQHNMQIGSQRAYSHGLPTLDLTTDEDVENFVEALPLVKPYKMLLTHSVLLGPFESFVWQERFALGRVCRNVVKKGTATESVLTNAIRILIFLNDREVISLTRPLRGNDGLLASFAWMIPVLLDDLEELPKLEAIVLSPETTLESRIAAISMATHLGGDVGKLLEQVASMRPKERRGLEYILLMQAMFEPFPEAVSLLSTALDEKPDSHDIYGGILIRLAETSFPGTEPLLIKALHSPNNNLVTFALSALQLSRHSAALEPILELIHESKVPELRMMSILAALASSPDSIEPFRDVWGNFPDAVHWRWVLAGRLRDSGEAAALVEFATDETKGWISRRLSILAASRLPFSVAMKEIAPVLLKTPLLLVEESQSLQTHELLAGLLKIADVHHLARFFQRGRDGFIRFWASVYKDLFDKHGVLPAEESVGCLWDRLNYHNFENDIQAFDKVTNELHVPMLQSAVLLGLRRQGRLEDLFTAFEQASTNWLKIRVFNELRYGNPLSVKDEQRAQEMIKNAPPLIQYTLSDVSGLSPSIDHAQQIHQPVEKPSLPAHIRFNFEQAQAFLNSGEKVDSKTIVLELDEHEFRKLLVDLDPSNDTEWLPPSDEKPQLLSLSETGCRIHSGRALEPVRPHYDQRSALRPALAAANNFGIDFPWHRTALMDKQHNSYAERFFASLGAQNSSDSFIRMITDDAELLIPLLDSRNSVKNILPLIDERALPILDRFIQAGSGVFFQQLCSLICQIRTEVVLPSLTKVFRRWLVLLDQLQTSHDSMNSNKPEWRAVWQTLALLKKHPYFFAIPQIRYRLLEILTNPKPLLSRDRRGILELLRDWAPAYIQFETEVFRQVDYGHSYEDKVDIYDEIADTLFRRTR